VENRKLIETVSLFHWFWWQDLQSRPFI
jgi:hypothetical protein